jgi:hypothetical protein
MNEPTRSDDGVQEIRVEALLGRVVSATNGRPVGRIEEFRAEMRNGRLEITSCVFGVGGLIERLGVAVTLLFGGRGRVRTVRRDQLDFTTPDRPRLTCRVDELEPAR